ncbi:MAG: SufB/SufD family protein [Eubacteriales bacterium]
MALSQTELNLLRQIADLEKTPHGAYNIRKNGQSDSRASTENIVIESKTDKPGIDIRIKNGTKNESVHIPVIVTQSGLTDMVYNDFYIGDDCDVLIVAGCGIHNSGCETSQHDGIHTFYVGKNSKLRYVEKHYGEGEGSGARILNPATKVFVGEGSTVTLETTQIKGVDSTKRVTDVYVGKGAEVVVNEKLMTHGKQKAISEMEIVLEAEGANGRVLSRSVATDESEQIFYPKMTGKAAGFGHVECDSIIMGHAKISSIPAIVAEHPDSVLVHEAAIGKIAGEQLLKLMTLGLDEKQAEERILKGFLN